MIHLTQEGYIELPRAQEKLKCLDIEEIDEYELVDNDYVIIDGNCIYKIELDKELDMENNFVEVAKTQDDTYEFITWFYDGGTDLGEMLQKGFDKTRKEVL